MPGKKGKLGLILIIVGVILLVLGIVFAVLLGTPSADYTEDDLEDTKTAEEIMKMSDGEEFTVLYEDINKTMADGLNAVLSGGSVSEGDTVGVTYKMTAGIPMAQSAEVGGSGGLILGIILLIVGVLLMVVGILKKKKAGKEPETPPPGAAPPPPQPPQY